MLRTNFTRIARRLPGKKREAGQALVMFAVGLAAFCGLVGLSVDVGNLLTNRRGAQNDADAAALAAVGKLADGGSVADAIAEAHKYAQGKNTTVAVNIPPTSGPSAGDTTAAEVIVTRSLPKFFIQVVYTGTWQTSARSVAKLTRSDSGFGVVALDPHACASLLMDSNSKLKVRGGGVFVDSDCATAFETNSNVAANASTFSITGNWKNGGSVPSPAPLTHQPPLADPWAAIPTPSMPSNLLSVSCGGSGNTTIAPGVARCTPYQFGSGTLTLSGPAGSTFVFRGGLKMSSNTRLVIPNKAVVIFDGGGATLDSAVNVSAPNGVLFYNKCNGMCSGNDKVFITSNSVVNVKPYGAPYDSIVFFQQRNNMAQMYFDANVSMALQGGIYAPAARVYIDSNCTTPLQFVVGTLHIDAAANIDIDVSNLSKIPGAPSLALTE